MWSFMRREFPVVGGGIENKYLPPITLFHFSITNYRMALLESAQCYQSITFLKDKFMNKRRRIIPVLLLAGAICSLLLGSFTGCRVFKKPEPRLPARLVVRVFNITPERAALKINGAYYNPNNYAFTFKGGDLDLMLDTFHLGRVHLDTVIEVPAHAVFNVPVVIEPDFEKLGQSGINLGDSVRISFKGDMKGSVGVFSRTIQITYEGIHYLDLQLP